MPATTSPHSSRARSASPHAEQRASGDLKAALRVGLLCLVAAALADLLIRHERGLSGDEPFYERMASHPAGPHNFPYAYRVAVPWLVRILPFSHLVSFTAISLLAIAASGAGLYLLLSEFRVGVRVATGLVLGFALSPTLLIVLVRHGRSIDPASILVMVLGCLFIVRRRRLALLLTLLIGAAVRESTLFLIPFAYAVWAEQLLDRRALRDVAVSCLLPLGLYVFIRASVAAVGQQYIPGYAGPFFKARLDLLRSALAGPAIELRRLAYTYGPIWLMAPLAIPISSFARRSLVLVALLVASFTYAYDWGRIIFLGAPVFYVATGIVLRDRRRLAAATVVVLLAVDMGYGIYLEAYGVRHGLDETTQHVPVY